MMIISTKEQFIQLFQHVEFQLLKSTAAATNHYAEWYQELNPVHTCEIWFGCSIPALPIPQSFCK